MKAYSIKELAALWGVSYHTIWRAVERGELPAAKIGRTVRIREMDAEAWWQANQVSGQSGPEPIRTRGKLPTSGRGILSA